MELLKSLFAASPILALFLCVAMGYAIGKIRIGQFQLGGIVGTHYIYPQYYIIGHSAKITTMKPKWVEVV